MAQQRRIMGEIDVMFLVRQQPRGLRKFAWFRRLLRLPDKEYRRWGPIQTTSLLPGYCILIGRDESSLHEGISERICPAYRRWFLIINADDVSRRHAVAAYYEPGGYYHLYDLGSANGLFLCQTSDRAVPGSLAVTRLDVAGESKQALHLIKGPRLLENQPLPWVNQQYCFLGQSTLLRLRIFGAPQMRKQDGVGTRILVKPDGIDSSVIHG